MANSAFSYKYNGKELQSETGMIDYGWRQYMPEIGRWNGIDQLAEMYVSTSTYSYVANNPVLRFDVDGRWFNDDGTIDTSGRTPNYVSGKQYRDSFLGVNRNNGGGGSVSGMSPDLFNKMFALGGTWENTGYGFENTDHISLGYNGSYISLNTLLDGFIEIPEVVFSSWGSSYIQSRFNSYMNKWNAKGKFDNYSNILSKTSFLANTAIGLGATVNIPRTGVFQYNDIWHQTKTRGTSFSWEGRWKNPGAKYWRGQQVKGFQGARSLGTKLTVAGGVFLAADIAMSGQVKPSHMINAAMLGASFSGVGSIVAGAWFVADMGTGAVNYLNGNGFRTLSDVIDQSDWGQSITVDMYDGLY
ncbi:RHS repeat-associated core domain-containing protein [Chryseobacterium sp. YIM B08800]|uniref:RHS repeat-associated core domain-containing protein n=1 Tax=Chryseobacterium sp. YIM B08800 TaxID=2984136 RepID=UPI00223F8850|nr:RHS repeat-associated core domain-containing protein [Chryseobacterium sp. YIM B08800]